MGTMRFCIETDVLQKPGRYKNAHRLMNCSGQAQLRYHN